MKKIQGKSVLIRVCEGSSYRESTVRAYARENYATIEIHPNTIRMRFRFDPILRAGFVWVLVRVKLIRFQRTLV